MNGQGFPLPADLLKLSPRRGYAGVKDRVERVDLIAWLQQATRADVSCSISR